MEIKSALYLIPVGISDAPPGDVIPTGVTEIMAPIRHFIVENVRTARRWLRGGMPHCDIDSMTFHELNRHTDLTEIGAWLDPLRQGLPMGIMSEAGCPGVADPGAAVVAIAEREGRTVVPLAGPSSILMALMASGFNGQGFTFNGYLPIEEGARAAAIRRLEKSARNQGISQIFIATPYRNQKLLAPLTETLRPDTLLCVACGITDPEKESVKTLPASRWRQQPPLPAKTPAVFVIGS